MSPELRQECIEVLEQLVSLVEGEFSYGGWEKGEGKGGSYDYCVRADKLIEELKRA